MLTDATFMVRTNSANLTIEELRAKLDEFLALESIMIEKVNKKKQLKKVDIKSLIGTFAIVSVNENEVISNVTLVSGSSGNLKPDILLKAFYKFLEADCDSGFIRIHRTMLFGRVNDRKVPLYEMK
jgi:hypothetical protein